MALCGNQSTIILQMTSSIVKTPVITSPSTVVTTASPGATYMLDLSVSTVYSLTITQNVTLSCTGLIPGSCVDILLKVTSTGGPFTITGPTTTSWPSGASTVTTTANKVDIYRITTFTYSGSSSSSWYGSIVGSNYS